MIFNSSYVALFSFCIKRSKKKKKQKKYFVVTFNRVYLKVKVPSIVIYTDHITQESIPSHKRQDSGVHVKIAIYPRTGKPRPSMKRF